METTRRCNLKLPDTMMGDIERIAKAHGMHRTETLRQFLRICVDIFSRPGSELIWRHPGGKEEIVRLR